MHTYTKKHEHLHTHVHACMSKTHTHMQRFTQLPLRYEPFSVFFSFFLSPPARPLQEWWVDGNQKKKASLTGRIRQGEPEIHVPGRLSVGPQNCSKNGGPPDLNLTLFLVENGQIRLHSALVRHRHTPMIWIAQNCSVLQGECGRSNRKSMYPCRLSVGAQNRTKTGGRPDLKLTLLSGRKWRNSRAQFAPPLCSPC